MERGWTLFQSGVVLCKRCLAEVGSLLTGSQLVKWDFFPGGQKGCFPVPLESGPDCCLCLCIK